MRKELIAIAAASLSVALILGCYLFYSHQRVLGFQSTVSSSDTGQTLRLTVNDHSNILSNFSTTTANTFTQLQTFSSGWAISATSTGTKGIALTGGCFSINGTCLTAGGSGTVTSVAAGTGLNGGTITTTGTVSLKSYIGTSTADTANQLLVWSTTNGTPANISSFSTLTFASAGALLTVTNASTTNVTASQSAFVASKQVNPYQNATFAYGATSTAWTGTTTETKLTAPFTGTIQDVVCDVPTGTLNVQFKVNSTNVTPMIVGASSTIGTYTFTGSNTFVRGDVLEADFGTPASSPTLVTCTPRTTVTSF